MELLGSAHGSRVGASGGSRQQRWLRTKLGAVGPVFATTGCGCGGEKGRLSLFDLC